MPTEAPYQMTRDSVYSICLEVAPKFNLDPLLVLAVCEQESDYHMGKPRLEQGYYRRYVEPTVPKAQPAAKAMMATSFGLMQVMGLSFYEMKLMTAEDLQDSTKVAKFFDELIADPHTQIYFGCRWMARKRGIAGGNERRMLVLWNGRETYADEVYARRDSLKKEMNL